MIQSRFFRWASTLSMLLALLLWVSVSSVHAEVVLPNGEFQTSVEDMRVKVLGDAVVISRKWINAQWYLNPSWADLKFTYDNADGSVAAIDRAGSAFQRTGSGAYMFDSRFFIKTTAGGYQWYDRLGNTVDYDTTGKILGYADRNGIKVSFTYDAGGNKSQVLDHFGNVVMRFTYSGGVLAGVADTTGRSVQYQFTGGNLTQVTDVLSHPSSYTYDANSQLLTLTDAENRTTTLTYAVSVAAPTGRWGTVTAAADARRPVASKDGRVISAKDVLANCPVIGTLTGAPSTCQTGTSTSGAPISTFKVSRVATLTDATSKTTTYSYEYDRVARQYTTTVTTPTGKKTVSVHDATGKPLEQTANGRTTQQLKLDANNVETTYDERGLATRVQYDSARNPLTTTYPDGTSVTTTYDSVYSNPLLTTNELGVQTKYDYDSKGNLLTLTEALGLPEQRITTFTYDQYGQLLTKTRKGATSANDATVTTTYDNYGNVATVTDALTNVTSLTYDVMGNVVTKKDARDNTVTYAYNAMGWRTSVTDALNHTTGYEYDNVGNRTKVTDALKVATQYKYDANNRLQLITDALSGTKKFDYDDDGNKTKDTDANNVVITYQFDADGRFLKTTDGNNNVTSIEYGATGSGLDGLLTAVNFPTYRTEYKYDQRSRIAQTIQVLDVNTRYTTATGYNAAGHTISQTDAAGRTTLNKYDALGRLVQTTDPIGGLTQFTYDARDNLLTVTDANANTTQYAYDLANRKISEMRPAGGTTLYAFDAAGNLVTWTDAEGQKRKYTYDAVNRRVKEEHYPLVNGILATTSSQTIAVTYDDDNQLTAFDDGNTSSTFIFDALNRRTSETINYGTFIKTLKTDYYPNGLKKTLTYDDGTTVSYAYDANNQIKTIVTPGGTISHDTYEWSKPTTVSVPGVIRTMTYDPLLRTNEIKVQKAGGGQVLFDDRYTYNSASAILQRQTLDGAYSYAYDNLDRLTQATPPVNLQASPTNPSGLPVEQYTYDGVHNRLSSAHQPGTWTYNGDNQLLGYGQTALQYDANGHMLKQTKNGQDTNYQYNVAERMVTVMDAANSPIASYTYDPFGRRIKKTANGQTTYFQYSDEGLVAEYDGTGTLLQSYGWLPASSWGTNPQFKRDASGTYFYTNDQLGTPQQLTDINGNVVWGAKEEAFGKTAADAASSVSNNLRFPGQYFDQETNLHYNYFRDYDPATGRYVESDPIGLGGGINTYTYVRSNPLRWKDPLGLEGCGSGGNEPVVPNNPLGFPFKGCCDRHDDCYDDCKNKPTRDTCDRNFCQCVASVCNKYPFFITACFDSAALYCSSAKAGGQSAFDDARAKCPDCSKWKTSPPPWIVPNVPGLNRNL